MVAIGQQLVRNILSSWGGYLIRLIITFFFVPYIASVFGDARYGVWVIIFQTINYFSLLDIGLTSALTRYISRHLSERDYDKINRILSTSNLLYFVVGSIVFGGIYLFVTFFFGYFKIGDPALITEGKNALLILGAFMAFNFYLLPFGNSLAGFQRHDITRVLAIIEEIVRVLIMVWLLKLGYGLVALALVILSVSVAKHIAGVIWLRKLHPQVRFLLGKSDAATVKMLLGYSRVSFGITIGWLIMFNTDTFLLGILSSSVAAGVYNPGAQLMLYLRNIINSIGTPLMPAISHIEASGDIEKVSDVYLRGIKYISYLSFLLGVGVVVFARPFVNLWLPPEFAEAADVMMILAFGTSVFLPQIIGNSVLFGIGQHRYILYTLIAESAVKIILSIILIPRYNLIGMALANAVPQVVFYLTLYPYFMSVALRLPLGQILRTFAVSASLAVVVAAPVSLILRTYVIPASWISLAFDVIAVALVASVPAYFILEPDDRRKFVAFFKRH
ncbi:MAG: flippase [Candidatus Zixiibacteriota bacterium]